MEYTFCLLSCGEDTEKECLESISHFRNKITFQEVRNIYPQSNALNTMIDQCSTQYLIPLDSDFILEKNAFDRIQMAVIENTIPNWHSILFSMWDTLTQTKVRSLKVFNVEIIKKIKYTNVRDPDAKHYHDLMAAGYTCIEHHLDEKPIGNHVCRGNERCYFRYKDIALCKIKTKNKRFAIDFAIKTQEKFLKLWEISKNDDYLYCIFGLYAGLRGDELHVSKSNDYEKIEFNKNSLNKVLNYFKTLSFF